MITNTSIYQSLGLVVSKW